MLHHEIIGGPLATRTCWVLHGLLGSGLNWRSFIKGIAPTVPHWRFVLPDLRNHGASVGFQSPHTIDACSRDVEALCSSLGWTFDAFCAHSLGGKIALHTLDRMATTPPPAGPPRRRGDRVRAVILDAVPGQWNQDTQDTDRDGITKVMQFLKSTPMPVVDRRQLKEQLALAGFSPNMCAWMLSNLKRLQSGQHGTRDGEHHSDVHLPMVWKFDPSTASELLADHMATDAWHVVRAPPAWCSMDFVVAKRSSRWRDANNKAQLDAVRQLAVAPPSRPPAAPVGRVNVVDVDCGHWVHVEQPEKVARVLITALSRPL